MNRTAIGLLGLGTVGSGVARILNAGRERLARRCGTDLELKWALVRDVNKPRGGVVDSARIVTDPAVILNDPEISVIVETIGGVEPARSLILTALKGGKHVVTANKALLAEHGPELFAVARAHDRAIAFEASVGGGVPVIQALGVALAANEIQSLAAILNGTCNFILTAMSEQGSSYEAALERAQSLGYAETDPTLDVDGTDTAHKLAILAQVGFHATVAMKDIPTIGINRLEQVDIRFAAELGYAVKLIARADRGDAGLALRVGPTLVKRGSPLAEVRGPYNAVRVVGDAVGDALLYGRGAGSMPTASAVVGDVIDVVTGRSVLTSKVSPYWSEPFRPEKTTQPEHVRSRYYLRFMIADRPGVLGRLAQALGERNISIASVIQHESESPDAPESGVPLVIMTHQASEAAVSSALEEIHRLSDCIGPCRILGVLD